MKTLSLLSAFGLGMCTLLSSNAFGQTNNIVSGPEILQELRAFREMGSVLYIAAHPDDENTQLITYLARGRGYRTAYLSLTRGDGGQNLLGPQLGAELGVARTQELLAARRLDGGQQFFTRAMDFGFSKDARETLGIWDRQQVLSDIVRVIRTFRPDVLITRFSPEPANTHGHHTASAILALEAFKLAGDTNAFPDQLTTLSAWQPKRILQNTGGFSRGSTNGNTLHMDISGNDPVTGEPFAQIAARSRAMHKTQGFGNYVGGGRSSTAESFQLLDGEPATNDILDGVDTTWLRVPGGDEIGKQADALIAKYDASNPSISVDAILALRKNLAALTDSPLVKEKRAQLDKILQDSIGLYVEATTEETGVVPGESIRILQTVTSNNRFDFKWMNGFMSDDMAAFTNRFHTSSSMSQAQMVPTGTPLTQPYWLQEPGTPGMFQVKDASLIGRAESLPAIKLDEVFQVGGQTLTIPIEVMQVSTNSGRRTRLEIISPVSLSFSSAAKLFAPGGSRTVEVTVTSARPNIQGDLSLDAPTGWKFIPAKQSFHFATAGQKQTFSFKVTAPKEATSAQLTARAKVGDVTYDNQHIEINYPHIPLQLLQPPARIKAVSLDLAIRGKRVGYLAGAGDDLAACMREMGYEVSELTGADLTTNNLARFDAVVVGIRAFNTRTDLVDHLPALFAFVEAGGNVIEQYNRPGSDLKTEQFTPYSLKLSSDRVTDENAVMTFLAPDHPVLNTPNKITSQDFAGWVQERGIYFPTQWDDHFTPILACNDAGEAPKQGSLLVAKYGQGYFVYTSLVFFRQLPEGVPGAYRLFANLLSLGK